MFQTILQKAAVAFQKIKNFYTVVETRSIPDFLKFVRNEKNPKIYIFLSWANYDRQHGEYLPCGARFTSFLNDGRVVVFKLDEHARVLGRMARDRKKVKQYINWRLLHESIKPQVQIMLALMPNAIIETRDLYGKMVNTDEFKQELF